MTDATPGAIDKVRILLISGSLRAGSTNGALLQTAAAVAPDGIAATVYDGMARLPHFNPDDDHDPVDPAVADLRTRIAASDALLLSTPEYIGALPGSFKNLLDWTVGSGATYEMPVAWVNVAASPTGASDAHDSLRIVMSRSGSDVVEDACVHIPVPRAIVGADGLIADEGIRAEIAGALVALAERVRDKRPS
ncbi:MAG: NAD(P)H-dependent oxidoreductase [Actinomycetia bacterium]|nr:NAD(P)H-dependent oxidoreductase [Actinomycetes bacterium]